MSDILKWLKEEYQDLYDDGWDEGGDRLKAAADEIERLRAELAKYQWISTKERLPEKPNVSAYEHVYCLVIYKGEQLIRPWNCEHLVWDDEDGDDFFCKPLDVDFWMPLPEKESE